MRRVLILLGLGALALPVFGGGPEFRPTANLAPPNAPKSEYRVGYGRDPFFPNSTDLMVAPSNTNVVKPIVIEQRRLKTLRKADPFGSEALQLVDRSQDANVRPVRHRLRTL